MQKNIGIVFYSDIFSYICRLIETENMRHSLLLTMTVAILATWNAATLAEAATQEMRHLTAKDGLAGITVSDIIDDPTGQIWIATSNGINLYDGTTLLTYPIPPDKTGMPNYCHNLSIDGEGNVYAATKGGLYRLTRHKDAFEKIVPAIESTECVLADGEHIYVGNRSGMHAIDKNGKTRGIPIGNDEVNANNSVRCIKKDGRGDIWFTTRNGITRYNPQTGKSEYHRLYTPSGLSMFDFSDGKIFIGSKNNGLYTMEIATGKSHAVGGMGNVINYVECHGKEVHVATNGKGAFVINADSETVTDHYGSDCADGKRLPTDGIYVFHRSKSGERWFGTYRYGLLHTYHQMPLFKDYSHGDFTTAGMAVQGFEINGDRKVITTSEGLYHIDEKSGRVDYHDLSTFDIHIIKNVEYHNGKYYIGSYDNGLLTFDETTGAVRRLDGWPQLEYATITSMCKNGGKLWISSSEGLFIIDTDGKVTNYNERNSKLPMGLHNIVFDSNGNGWLGTHSGLALFITKEDFIKSGDFPKGFFNHIPNIMLSTGHNGTIFGYHQTKIFHTDAAMKDFGQLEIPRGIIDESCSDFLDDGNGRYWIVSEKGLFCLKYDMSGVMHFGIATGLTGDITNSLSLTKDDKGNIWIVTNDGLKHMSLKDVKKSFDIAKFNILVNNATVGSHLLSNGELQKLNDTRTISLGWNVVAEKLVIRPTPPDYTQQTIKIMEYSTDRGKTWKMVKAGEYIVMENLAPGKHPLLMKLAGCDNTLTKLDIYVYPSATAVAEVFLLVILGVFFTMWERYRRRTTLVISEHHATEQALIEENIAIKEEKAEEEKYKKSRTADNELEKVARQVEKYIKGEKPYINKDLKMSDIATSVGVSPSVLSQVFSLYLKESYYDYINRYRLEEFKLMIAQGLHKKFTVTALSEQCGFKKTSFFSTFRKIEGMTPTEYIQKNGG